MQNSRPKPTYPLAAVIDNPKLTHVVANTIDVGGQTHALTNVVTQTPKVDDIAPRAQLRRMLNERRLESGCPQPEGERWSGNPCTRDQYGLIGFVHSDVLSTGSGCLETNVSSGPLPR